MNQIAALGFDFPVMSPLSRRAPWQVDRAECLPEIEREIARREITYPRFVARGQMTQLEADRGLAVLRAIADDYRRAAGLTIPPGAIAWDLKVRELRRELAMRRAAYPKWIASPSNPLTAADARQKLEALDAVHHDYWLRLFMFPVTGTTLADRIASVRAQAHAIERWEATQRNSGPSAVQPLDTWKAAA